MLPSPCLWFILAETVFVYERIEGFADSLMII
jgi:hypothetical protein